MKKILLTLLFSLCHYYIFAQNQILFQQNIINGGIIGYGGVNQFTGEADTINFQLSIPNGSTIEKSFLFLSRDDNAADISVKLNNISYSFSNQTAISDDFLSYNGGSLVYDNSNIHAIEITDNINASDSNYQMIFPQQNYLQGFYSTFYFFTVFNNNNLPKVTYQIIVNNQNTSPNVSYLFNNTNPIDTSKNVGLSVISSWICDTINDGLYVSISNDTLGLIGGSDFATQSACTGVCGNFTYYNDTLFGLDDDTPDSLMAGSDALANIQSYIPNNTTNIQVDFDYQSPNWQNGIYTNPIRLLTLSYTTPCDTFSTSINIPDTTICYGESLVLQVSGGATYQWEVFGNAVGNGSSLTLTPDSSAYYIVKITDTNGCMKTEMAHVVINPIMAIGGVATSPTVCKDSTGSITLQNTSGGIAFFGTVYQNSINGVNNTNIWSEEYNNLAEGSYTLAITDLKGCTATIMATVGSYINTVAQFSANPQSGEAPLNVVFTNQSSNANNYTWLMNSDSLTTTDVTYVFDSVGVYDVTLYAYGNDSNCVDSASVLINVVSPFRVFIPTFYDASLGSLFLDVRGCKTVTLEIFDEIGKLVYVETKPVTDGQNEFWKGYNARGIYLYRIFAEGIDGTKLEQGGKLVLMR